jgi:signal transduction histidine kinase
MRDVSATGHQALDEMRGLLGVLRTTDDSTGLRPQPGLADVGALLDQVRATGLVAELSVTGSSAALPPSVELTAYRIVQEAITNTLKHARAPRSIRVLIDVGQVDVTVDVHDDGAGDGTTDAVPGLGLTGMRERLAVHGGTLLAGPDPAGGWHVHAVAPLSADRSGRIGPPELGR